MAYASIVHVELANGARQAFTASSIPNASAVAQFIDEAAGIIDAVLVQAGYSAPVPVTGTPSSVLSLLQNANVAGACYYVESAAQLTTKRDQFKAMWEEALKMIGDTEMPGLAKLTSTALPRQGLPARPPDFFVEMPL